MNFCEIILNWILNWIIFWRNSNIELNQFGYRSPLLWRLNPQLPCALQSWIILPYLFIFSYPLFRAFVWPIDEVRGQARKYCINNWPFPFYDLTTLIKKYQLIWLYSACLFFSKLHFNVACLTPEVWWMFRKQKNSSK